jgi:hypothetical protein
MNAASASLVAQLNNFPRLSNCILRTCPSREAQPPIWRNLSTHLMNDGPKAALAPRMEVVRETCKKVAFPNVSE